MGSGFTVYTTFNARGNLGRELRSLKSEFGQVGRFAGMAKRTVVGFGMGMAAGGVAALAFGIREVATEYKGLDQSITNAASKWGPAFDRGTQGFDDLMEAAKRVGLTTEHQASVAADGLNFLAMAGFTAEESLALLPGVANLATAANLDFARSSDIASDALGAFGMAHGSASDKAAAFSKIMGQTAATVNKSNTDMSMWFESVKSGAPSFTVAGQKMSTFNTAVALLANNGIKGEAAGTALRGIMANLSKTSGKQAATLRQLGVSVKDSKGNFRDFADVLGDLEKKMAGMGTHTRTGILEQIFGKLQMGQMAILLQEGADRFRNFRAEIEDSAGAEVELANKMRKSIQNSQKLVESALVGKGIDIIQELFGGDDPAEALTNLATAIQEFDSGPLVEGLREAGRIIRDVSGWIYDHREMIKSLGKAYLAMKIGGWSADILNGGRALLGLSGTLGTGKTAFDALGRSAQVNSVFVRGLGRALSSIVAMAGPLMAVYAAAKFATDAIEENQNVQLESDRNDASIKRAADKADLTQYSDKNLSRMRELDAQNLKHKQDIILPNKRDRQERDTIAARIQRFDNEIARRKAEKPKAFAWDNAGYTPRSPEQALRDSERMADPRRPQETRNVTETRTEEVKRYEVDWGKPPPGVTVRQPLGAGGMP